MAKIIRDRRIDRDERPIGLALSVRQRRALHARDISHLVKVADDVHQDPRTGRTVMAFRSVRDLIAARFKKVRNVFA